MSNRECIVFAICLMAAGVVSCVKGSDTSRPSGVDVSTEERQTGTPNTISKAAGKTKRENRGKIGEKIGGK